MWPWPFKPPPAALDLVATILTLGAITAVFACLTRLYAGHGRRPDWRLALAGAGLLLLAGLVGAGAIFRVPRLVSNTLLIAGVGLLTPGLALASRQLLDAARVDALTGLFNRRHLQDSFAREAARARREGARFALVFIDLNSFKQVNDRLGHAHGDAALCRVAETLRRNTRAGDTLARWGGDEFVLLLAQVDRSGAESLAGRLAAAIAGLEPGPPLSASFGVVVFPDDGEHMEHLVRLADERMYAQKPCRSAG